MPNTLQTRIQAEGPLVGTFVTINSCEVAEALSRSDLDWLVFDWEHAPLSVADLQRLTSATHPPCLSFIRIPEPTSVFVKKALDTDCDGIIVPQVNSADIARQIIDAGKYAPLGNRGVGLSRSTGYGARLSQAICRHNEEKSILVQIEHIQAVQAIDEILGVPGIGGIFVGPYDLSSSMGHIGDPQHPQVQAAIAQVSKAAKARSMPAAIFIGNDDDLQVQLQRGFQLIAIGSDILRLSASARATAALPRQLLKT